MASEESSGSNSRRLSQIFDPLSRLTELTRASQSTPSSPRLLPRRHRDAAGGQADGLDPGPSRSGAVDPGAVNWQERCLELQLELHRSRTQATRTRDMLRDKTCQMITSFYTFLQTIDEKLQTSLMNMDTSISP